MPTDADSGGFLVEILLKFGHKEAIEKARKEYETFHASQIKQPSLVERHFLEAIKDVKALESETGKKRRPSKNGGSR